MSMAPSCAPGPPCRGPSGASIRITGRHLQLLPAPRPPRPDRAHPAAQESPRQRPRLQAGRRLPARAHRPPPRARSGAPLPLEFRMDAAFFQRDVLRLLAAPRLRLRHQGRLLELAAPQAAGRRARALAAPGARGDRLRARAGDPAVEPAAPRDDLSQARRATRPEELPARPLHPRRRALRVLRRRHQHDAGPRPRCSPSSVAAAPRRRPSPNSRASSRSTSSRPTTTGPTAPGSS